MARCLSLTRQCLGLQTRIECLVRPLAGEQGLWTLLCAAGLAQAQPSAIKVQGPFHGPCEAEGVLTAIADNLALLGYVESVDPCIWSLHLQAELRRLNGRRRRPAGDFLLHPET